VIKFVSELWQVSGFLQILRLLLPIKVTSTEILLKVAFNAITIWRFFLVKPIENMF
jgi:hypothetical protein